MILGIDPGLSGGFALWHPQTRTLRVASMPILEGRAGKKTVDAQAVLRLLAEWAPIKHAWIELVNGIPGQGAPAAFNFGFGCGLLHGALAASRIPFTPVSPLVWKAHTRTPKDKHAARARASEVLPEHAHLWPRAKDDGLAEASLIALYGAGLTP